MNDTTFARKYRPATLNAYTGNRNAVKQLRQTLASGYRPQVILIDGPAGCGKTTLARLIGKEYCCTNRDPEKGACNICDNCLRYEQYIKTGDAMELMNLHEYDCSNVGKSEADKIVEEMEMPTVDGGWRVFILDEAHLLTQQAMGALRKTLEEPTQKRLVMLCTTNPERLLNTIRSRCDLILSVEKQKQEDMTKLLEQVCTAEKATYDARGLNYIAARSDNEPRTALKTLQSVLTAEKSATYEKVLSVLQETTDASYFRFLELCIGAGHTPAEYLHYLYEIRRQTDLRTFLKGLTSYVLRGLYIYNGIVVQGMDKAEVKTYAKLFGQFDITKIRSVLSALTEAETAENIELCFVTWGYTGMRPFKQAIDEVQSINTCAKQPSEVAGQETAEGVKQLNAAKEPTEEEMHAVISANKSSLTASDMLQVFGNATVLRQ